MRHCNPTLLLLAAAALLLACAQAFLVPSSHRIVVPVGHSCRPYSRCVRRWFVFGVWGLA